MSLDSYSINIQSCGELQNISNDMGADYNITNNIDCTGFDFEPIGNFTNRFNGTIEGNDYTISNVFINESLSQNVGIISYIENATISNINFNNTYVEGDDFVGGFAGLCLNSQIDNISSTNMSLRADVTSGGFVGNSNKCHYDNIYISGEINTTDVRTGGIIGFSRVNTTIRNSYANVNITSSGYAGGIIGRANEIAEIINCHTNVQITVTTYPGGIVGYMSVNDGKIENSSANVILINSLFSIGGLAGFITNSEIINSYSIGSPIVTTTDSVGGLIGSSTNVDIYNSYSTINVSGNRYVGGLIGTNNGNVNNSYSTGSVSIIASDAGGLIGRNLAGTITDSYYDTNTSGQTDTGKGEPKTTIELQNTKIGSGIYQNWSDSIWTSFGEFSYPRLIWDVGTVEIQTCQQLQDMSHFLSGDYNITNNINCTGFNFTPVGNITNPFIGTLEGNGYNISNLLINISPSNDFNGLFGYTLSATVNNLTLTNTQIIGNQFSGPLAGYFRDSTINHVSSENVNIRGGQFSGGLVGYSFDSNFNHTSSSGFLTIVSNTNAGGLIGRTDEDSNVYNSFSSVNINTTSRDTIGGLIGQHRDSGKIVNSYATGDIKAIDGVIIGGLVGLVRASGEIINCSASGNIEGQTTVGGLIGQSQLTSGSIINSSASGNVSGNSNVGGLLGALNQAQVYYSFASGNVVGTDDVGGLIGDSFIGTIFSSYATGNVNSSNDAGGLIGKFESSTVHHSYSTGLVSGVGGGLIGGIISSTVNQSYYDINTSGQNDTGKGEPKTTLELQNTEIGSGIYQNWSTSIWDSIDANSYPDLIWNVFENITTQDVLDITITNFTLTNNTYFNTTTFQFNVSVFVNSTINQSNETNFVRVGYNIYNSNNIKVDVGVQTLFTNNSNLSFSFTPNIFFDDEYKIFVFAEGGLNPLDNRSVVEFKGYSGIFHNLSNLNSEISDMVLQDNNWYVSTKEDEKVYVFDFVFTFPPTNNFTLSTEGSNLTSLFYQDSLWNVVLNTNNVFQYFANFDFTNFSFDAFPPIVSISDMYFKNGNWFMLDSGAGTVYLYDENFTYAGTSYDISAQDSSPSSISNQNGNWYIFGDDNNKIFEYTDDFNYTGRNFSLISGPSISGSINFNDFNLYVVDRNDTQIVYEYLVILDGTNLTDVRTFTTDTTPPQIDFTNVSEINSLQVNWTTIFNYSDVNLATCIVNNASCTELFNFSSRGNKLVTVNVTDIVGNTNIQNKTIFVNPPVIINVSFVNTSLVNNTYYNTSTQEFNLVFEINESENLTNSFNITYFIYNESNNLIKEISQLIESDNQTISTDILTGSLPDGQYKIFFSITGGLIPLTNRSITEFGGYNGIKHNLSSYFSSSASSIRFEDELFYITDVSSEKVFLFNESFTNTGINYTLVGTNLEEIFFINNTWLVSFRTPPDLQIFYKNFTDTGNQINTSPASELSDLDRYKNNFYLLEDSIVYVFDENFNDTNVTFDLISSYGISTTNFFNQNGKWYILSETTGELHEANETFDSTGNNFSISPVTLSSRSPMYLKNNILYIFDSQNNLFEFFVILEGTDLTNVTTYTIDTTPPQLNFTNVSEINSYQVNWTTIFNYSDVNLATCIVNNASCTELYNFSFAGNNTVIVNVTDLAGNSNIQNKTILVDPFQTFYARDPIKDLDITNFTINNFSTLNGTLRIPLFDIGLGNQSLNFSTNESYVNRSIFLIFNLTSNYNLTLNITDITQPQLNFTNVSEINSYQVNWTTIFNYSDVNLVSCIVNNASCTELYNFSFAGNNTVIVNVTDIANNSNVQNKTILVNPFQTFHATDNIRAINISTFIINNFSTSNGTLKIPLFDIGLGNQSLEFDASGYEPESFILFFNLTSDYDVTFNVTPATLSINAFDEESLNPITGFDLFISNSTKSLSVTNVTNFEIFLDNVSMPLGQVTVEVSKTNYTTREYILNINDRSIITLNAYLLNLAEGSFIDFFIFDSSSNVVEDALITIYRRLNESDTAIEQVITDASGYGGVFIDTTISNQYFIVLKDGFVQQQFSIRPTTTEYQVYLTPDVDVWQTWDNKVSYYISPTYNIFEGSLELNFSTVNENNDFTLWGFRVYDSSNNLIDEELSIANSGGSLSFQDTQNISRLRVNFFYQIGTNIHSFDKIFQSHSSLYNYSEISLPVIGEIYVEDETIPPVVKIILFSVIQIFVISIPHMLPNGKGKGIYVGWLFLLGYSFIGGVHWGLALITIISTGLIQFDNSKRGLNI
jgi:hypothetical protein